jgi:Fe-Mn family superoxide dismutase
MYKTKTFNLIGLKGFSDKLLETHFTLYNGYVANTNKLIAKLTRLSLENKGSEPEYAELKRRFGWEFNGMRLHELYFGNMSKNPGQINKLKDKITKDFGSFENWEQDFKAVGAMRGIGWVILSYDKEEDKLFNVWINEHDIGHLAGSIPLLVMDVFEHAFITDYGLKRADYINVFFEVIDWKVVEERIT